MIIIRFLRSLLVFPIILLIEIIKIYNTLLSKLDPKNHNTFFEEYLQNIIDKKISKKIYLTKKKFIRLHIPTKISSFRAKTFFSKEPDTINWMFRSNL